MVVRGLRESRASDRSSPSASRTRRLQDWWFGPDYGGSVERSTATRRGGCARSTSARTTAGSRWRSPRAARTSASTTSSASTGSWPRSSDINITVHVAMDRFGYTKSQIRALQRHGPAATRTRRTCTRRTSPMRSGGWCATPAGTSRFAPQIEIQMGHGWAPAVTASNYGMPIGLSSDVATTASADQFTQMHAIFGSERAGGTGGVGRGPRRPRRPRPTSSLAAGAARGRRWRAPRSRASAIGPAR